MFICPLLVLLRVEQPFASRFFPRDLVPGVARQSDALEGLRLRNRVDFFFIARANELVRSSILWNLVQKVKTGGIHVRSK